MRNKLLLAGMLVITLIATLSLSGNVAAVEDSSVGQIIPGKFIVVLAEDVEPAEIAREHGLAPTHTYRAVLKGFAGAIPAAKLANLRADTRVLRIEPDRRYKVDAQFLPTGVNRIEADLNPTIGGLDIGLNVAIFDTGIDPDHPDLDVGGGFNGRNPANPTDYDDFSGHGTHVAGIVGAKDNGIGVVGVAPGATLWAIRVCYPWIFNLANCDESSMVNGLDMVAACKMRAQGDLSATCEIKDRVTGSSMVDGIDFASANMSIQTPDQPEPCDSPGSTPTPVHLSICGLAETGVPLAISAGNNGGQRQAFPETIATSAIVDGDGQGGGSAGNVSCSDGSGQDDTLWGSSNSGPEVDLAAPGVCIYSTWLNGGYKTVSGTSMAAPHAAGAMALYLHANDLEPATDASGAAAIRQAVIDAGLPKGAACSYTSSRSDANEPLLFVNGPTFGGTGAILPCVGGNMPPVADAGSAQSVTDSDNSGSELVALNGSGSYDNDGFIESYEWREGGVLLATGETPLVDFAVGAHDVTLTVTDDDLGTASDQVSIVVNPGNVLPVADAGSAQSVTDSDNSGSEWVTLNGSGSYDSDGFIESYEWREGGVLLATGETPLVDFAVGVHDVTLTVTDDDLGTASDQVSIVVQAGSAEPEPHIGDLDGASMTAKGQWTAAVYISVHWSDEQLANEVTVTGAWDDGSSSNCTTSSGYCTVFSAPMPKKTSSATFTVNTLEFDGQLFPVIVPPSHDPDNDSDGRVITVPKDAAEPPPPVVGTNMHVGGVSGSPTLIGKNKWRATVIVSVHDENESPVANANVSGSWSGQYSGSGSCVTADDGSCTITSPNFNLNSGPQQITFTVLDLGHATLIYDDGANHDPPELAPSVTIMPSP